MNSKPVLLLCSWVHDSIRRRLAEEFPKVTAIDARERGVLEQHLALATIVYGCPPVELLPRAKALRWLQLASAGVPLPLCDALREGNLTVTNLAGLYGPTIAEHALALMLIVARQLHTALRQQHQRVWLRELGDRIVNLHGRTAAVVGLGNIGQNIARLCRAMGMRVIGCRRGDRPTPFVDQVYLPSELRTMLGELSEGDFVLVAAPWTRETDGLLGPAEFDALKPGVFYVNVSRGQIAKEDALLDGLRSGRVAAAGLDVFAVEPLPADHPFWNLPNVVVSPHYSGETVNRSAQPGELLLRNLRAFMAAEPVGKIVDLAKGY